MSAPTGILGHDRSLGRLLQALDADSLHHAYLFEGPRGVGKSTVARYLARRANCTAEAGQRPCGRCTTCRQIEAGTHPDVILLEPSADRASRTISVDEVREVVRKTGYHRYGSRRRFVLVEPAEAMQPAAANALLKTLEEPPEGTGFILVCTNASSLLPTIISRCQRVRFGAVPAAELTRWLREKGHGDAAERAAYLSQGCPGRALALLDGELEKRNKLRSELLATLSGDRKGRFDWTAKLVKGKRQDWTPRVAIVLELIEDLLRDAAIAGAGSETGWLNSDEPEVVRAWARALWPDGVRRLHDALEETRDSLGVMVSGRLAVDALLARVAAELGH